MRKELGLPNPPWVEFVDGAGWGICQWDAVIPGHVPIVLEMKLTQKAGAYEELSGLYLPVAEEFFGRPCAGLVVCRTMKYRTELFFDGTERPALKPGDIGTWFLRL